MQHATRNTKHNTQHTTHNTQHAHRHTGTQAHRHTIHTIHTHNTHTYVRAHKHQENIIIFGFVSTNLDDDDPDGDVSGALSFFFSFPCNLSLTPLLICVVIWCATLLLDVKVDKLTQKDVDAALKSNHLNFSRICRPFFYQHNVCLCSGEMQCIQ